MIDRRVMEYLQPNLFDLGLRLNRPGEHSYT